MNSGINVPLRLEEIDIRELLPQQEPFVMVDRLKYFDEKVTSTQFLIRADNLFVEDGHLNACAIAENMAQTCAARLGYVNTYILRRNIQIGVIGSINGMEVFGDVKVGDILNTEITVMEQIMELTLVHATVKVCERMIASANMKIALTEEETA